MHDEVIHHAVRQALDATGEAYELLACDPDLADTAAFCAHYGYSPEESVNTIIVVGKGEPRRYAACAVTADARLDVNGTVRRRLGVRKASFASAEETRELTGMMIGGVTPVALPATLPIWVDARVMQQPMIILGGGSRSQKIRARPSLLGRLAGTEIVEGLATRQGAPPEP